MKRVAITIDFEPDCPPFLSDHFRGITEGAPKLLELFRDSDVAATFFTTGDVAARFPDAVQALVDDGHELGCHGMTHTAFDRMDTTSAKWEINESVAQLRRFAPVTSFRAPYLRFPERYVSLLEEANFTLDSSQAKYKLSYLRSRASSALTRAPASMTSSVLRLPAAVRDRWLRALADPVVLFVHPWEFVDLRRERIRADCRFRTGDVALECLREVMTLFRRDGASFVTMRELATG
jgi:peptidoglycan/xylan/chitin deacetylase (PgdA/CDA1 family)